MNTRKLKRHRNSDTKTRQQRTTTELPHWNGQLKLVLRAQSHPQFLKLYRTFSWLFGSHDDPLTRQRIITVNASVSN